MAPYSMHLRTRVLADWDAGVAAKELAAKFRVSRSWVNRLCSAAERPERCGHALSGSLRNKQLRARKIDSCAGRRPT
jgi:hypothetical protein